VGEVGEQEGVVARGIGPPLFADRMQLVRPARDAEKVHDVHGGARGLGVCFG
jgi:hypothetical protein